ncbi:hypothetical protein M1293_00200 [Candidatus Parvarchaeota archaeon]|nr:hypothetical protein [Candidatus Parvarchaeota archaeon]
MSLTNKSQSALEYMMTYGWAILIIVIVAAVLYEFGIFSPSNLVSTTITGFSGVKVTSVAADPSTLAMQLTDISASPVQITQINATVGPVYTTFTCQNDFISQGGTTDCYVKGNFTSSPTYVTVSIGYISQGVFNTFQTSVGSIGVALSPFVQSSPFPTPAQENNIAYVGSWPGALDEVNLSSDKVISSLGNPTWGNSQIFVAPNGSMAFVPDSWTTLGVFKLPSFQLIKKYWGNSCNHYITMSQNMEYAFVSFQCGNFINVFNLSSNSYYNFKNIVVQNTPGELITASNGDIYVVNQNSQSISVISPTSLSNIANITNIGMSGGGYPWAIGYDSQNGNMYVPSTNYCNNWNNISIVSTATNSLVGTINGLGPNPRVAVYSPNGKYVYVDNFNNVNCGGNSDTGTISIVNASNWVVIKNINVQELPRGIAVNPTTGTIYVENSGSNSISVISNSTYSVTSTITGNGLNYPRGITIANGDLYVSNWNGNSVSVFSLSNNAAVTTIPVQSNPWRLAVSSNGAYVYVPDYSSGNVAVISTSSNSVLTYIGVGCNPSNIVVVPGSQKAFGTCWNSNQVFIINTSSNSLISGAFGVLTAGNNLRAIGVSPNGQDVYVAAWSMPGQIAEISTSTDQVVARKHIDYTISDLLFNPQGNEIVAVYPWNGISPIYFYNPSTLQETGRVGMLYCPSSIAISPNGKYAAVPVNCQSSISIINLSSGVVLYTKYDRWGNPQMETFSPNSQTLYFSTGGAIESLDVATGKITSYKVVGGCPWWVSTGPGGNHVYLSYSCGYSNWQNMQEGISVFSSSLGNQTNINGVGITIGGLALSQDSSKLYMTNNNGCGVETLSTSSNSVENYPFCQFNWGSNNILIDGNIAYVNNNGDWQNGSVAVYNMSSDMLITLIRDVGPSPNGLAMTSDGKDIYVVSSQAVNSPNVNFGNGTITEISTATNSIVGSFTAYGCPETIRTPITGDYAIISSQCTGSGVDFWDTATNTLGKVIYLGGCPYGMSLNPTGTLAFVVNPCNTQVSIINMTSQSLITSVSGGSMNNPQDIAVTPNGKYAYITNWNTNQLSVLNITAALLNVANPFLQPINLTQSNTWRSIVIGGGSYSST